MITEEYLQEAADDLLKDQFDSNVKIGSFSQLQKILAEYINHLITNNFSKLISVLYRLDISEEKLKGLLSLRPNKNAGDIIAGMIVERQLLKIRLRKTFTTKNDQISEDDRW